MTKRSTKYWNSGTIPLIAPDILGDIIADLADLALVISPDGMIQSVLVNPAHDFFRRIEPWEGKDVRQTLSIESVPKFDARLTDYLAEREARPLELNHADALSRWDFPIRYTFHRVGPDGAILMLGRDLRPVAEMQQQLVKAQMALERDYESQREYEMRFRVLLESSREAVIFVSVASGRITEINSAAANVLARSRDEAVGLEITAEFALRKRGDLLDGLLTQAIADRNVPVRAQLQRTGVAANLIPTLFRAAGERMLLLRIETETDAQAAVSDNLTHNLGGLFAHGSDAIVFTTDGGEILSANEAFLDFIDAAHDLNLRGRNLADYLVRGSIDLKVMIENAARTGRMRLYPTRIAGDFSNPRAVEISVTAIAAGSNQIFGFVLRDASRVDAIRPAAPAVADPNMQSVMELVGSATLKEIVAETTNVVEKMCIETAVELTMNNRVAAAEMLGLSRQSLYVKLRKFGLLERDGD